MASSVRRTYTKAALVGRDLILHLENKGLIVTDVPAALGTISATGYYRLLIYMRALQDPGTKRFRLGTRFEDVVALYEFDRQLRLLCLDGVERLEVALRAAVVEQLAVPYGPHFYLDQAHFSDVEAFCSFFTKATQARYLAIEHYRKEYDRPTTAPIWAVCEAITFGTLSHLYSGLSRPNRKAIEASFGFDETVLVSWFKTINDLRNACAHHNRLWDKKMLVNQPVRARALAHELVQTAQQRFYGRAIVLASLLNASVADDWKNRLRSLLQQYPSVSVSDMGFPADWQTRPFWA